MRSCVGMNVLGAKTPFASFCTGRSESAVQGYFSIVFPVWK